MLLLASARYQRSTRPGDLCGVQRGSEATLAEGHRLVKETVNCPELSYRLARGSETNDHRRVPLWRRRHPPRAVTGVAKVGVYSLISAPSIASSWRRADWAARGSSSSGRSAARGWARPGAGCARVGRRGSGMTPFPSASGERCRVPATAAIAAGRDAQAEGPRGANRLPSEPAEAASAP